MRERIHLDDELLTAAEIAKRLRVEAATVRLWAREGRIPSIRLGHKTIRFHLGDVLDAIRAADGEGGGDEC